MKAIRLCLLLALPILLASKPDPLAKVPPTDRPILIQGLQRFIKDQSTQDWADLYLIADQDTVMKRLLDVPDNAPPVDRTHFIANMVISVQAGTVPILETLDLTAVTPDATGYVLRACVQSHRQGAKLKGIAELHATLTNGTARFGSWTYIYDTPHSCNQKENVNF
jgi:hypothetical protein